MAFAGLKDFLTLEENFISVKIFFILIITAYIFAIAIRLIWVYQVKDDPSTKWNNQIIINNVDGYYYAEGARDILSGGIYQKKDDGSPVDSFPSILTAYLKKILPFSFETIILYMPAFFGSLIIIPILIIGISINQNYLGYIAALLASITISYYNRTMVGYYDTDMLTVVLPLFMIAALIHSLKHNKEINLLLIALAITIYQLWYYGGYSIIIAVAFILFFYTLIIEPKKVYNYKMIAFILIGIADIPFFLKAGIYFGLFFCFKYLKNKYDKYIIFISLAASLILILLTNGLMPVISNIKVYILRERIMPAIIDHFSLNFFSVKQTIQEAKTISFDIFAQRISGHILTFIISTLGYFLMIIRYPVMILAIPLIGLGFLAIKGGLRFTIYAVPINSLGFAYIASLFAKFITVFFKKQIKYIKPLILILITILALYPNITHIINYKKGSVVIKEEAAALEKLKKIANREDYVISWWDYGYPIRYYSDTKTLGDGGIQRGDTNFPLSFILTEDQVASANMARIAVEFSSNIAAAMKAYNFVDANNFLKALNNNQLILPKKKQDIYIYLPFRIINSQILPTIRAFCNLDIMTGKHYEMPLFYQTKQFTDNINIVTMGNSFTFFKKTGIIKKEKVIIKLNSLIVVGYDREGNFNKNIIEYDHNSNIYLIYMQSYGQFLLIDKKFYDSLFIRLFVLEDYDKKIYEPVILDPWTKIYRLKR